MKGCFIGNSHLAAIRKGWDAISADYPDVRLNMFASPGASLTRTYLSDGHLCAADSDVRESLLRTGGRERIPLTGYDFFVVVGCNIRIDQLWELFSTHNFVEANGQLVSRELLSAALSARFRKSCAAQLVRKIRAATAVPILVVAHPYPDFRFLERPRGKGFADVKQAGALGELKAIFERACESALEGRAEMVFQSPSTVVEEVFTREAFGARAPRLVPGNVEHAQQELLHMNADYGVAMLQRLFAVVGIDREVGGAISRRKRPLAAIDGAAPLSVPGSAG